MLRSMLFLFSLITLTSCVDGSIAIPNARIVSDRSAEWRSRIKTMFMKKAAKPQLSLKEIIDQGLSPPRCHYFFMNESKYNTLSYPNPSPIRASIERKSYPNITEYIRKSHPNITEYIRIYTPWLFSDGFWYVKPLRGLLKSILPCIGITSI